jgi:tetratricopeptide (TPR) repeat protein
VDEIIGRALGYAKARHFAEAAAQFLDAAALAPRDWRLPNEAGVCLQRIGRHAEAAVLYERALPLAPDPEVVRFNVGLAYLQSGELARAKEALAAVLAVQQHAGAAFELGTIAMKERAFDHALAYFDLALGYAHADAVQHERPMDEGLLGRVTLHRARLYGLELGRTGAAKRELNRLFHELDQRDRIQVFAREALARGNRELALAAAMLLIRDCAAQAEVRELFCDLGLAPPVS